MYNYYKYIINIQLFYICAFDSKIRRWFAAIYIAVYFHYSSRVNLILILSLYYELIYDFARIIFFGITRGRLSRVSTRYYALLFRTCSIFHYLPTIESTPLGCTSMYFWKLVYSYLRRWMSRALKAVCYPYVPSINVFHARKIKTNDTECRLCCAIAPRSSSARLSLIRR